jgi:hypothetical protein
VPIEVDLILASAATPDQSGGVSVLGGGWQVRPSIALTTAAIVVILRVPRKQQGTHLLTIQLYDYDDNPISVPSPQGPGLMRFEAAIEVAGLHDPALKTPLLAPYAINLPGFPVEPGKEFQWRVHVNGKTRPHWFLPFRSMTTEEESHLGIPADSSG